MMVMVRLDGQTDGVLEVCALCLPCTRNRAQAQVLRAAARIIDTLEPEMVPAVLQVHILYTYCTRVYALQYTPKNIQYIIYRTDSNPLRLL